MQTETDSRQCKDHTQIAEIQRSGLEDALHERDIHQSELRNERYRDRSDEHFVLDNATTDAPVLDSRDEIQDDKGSESLYCHWLSDSFPESGS